MYVLPYGIFVFTSSIVYTSSFHLYSWISQLCQTITYCFGQQAISYWWEYNQMKPSILCITSWFVCLHFLNHMHIHLIHIHEYHNFVKWKHTVLISMLELMGENIIKWILAFNTTIVYWIVCLTLWNICLQSLNHIYIFI